MRFEVLLRLIDYNYREYDVISGCNLCFFLNVTFVSSLRDFMSDVYPTKKFNLINQTERLKGKVTEAASNFIWPAANYLCAGQNRRVHGNSEQKFFWENPYRCSLIINSQSWWQELLWLLKNYLQAEPVKTLSDGKPWLITFSKYFPDTFQRQTQSESGKQNQ